MYKQNKNILMTQPSNVPSLEVYSLAASEPNKPRNCLWSADVNINASLHLVILFKSMPYCNFQLQCLALYNIITQADWLTEWGMLRACPHFLLRQGARKFVHGLEHARTFCLHVHATISLPPSFSLFLSLPLSLYLSLTCEQGAHTLFTSQRERKREGERNREREREREKEGGRERQREIKGKRDRER